MKSMDSHATQILDLSPPPWNVEGVSGTGGPGTDN